MKESIGKCFAWAVFSIVIIAGVNAPVASGEDGIHDTSRAVVPRAGDPVQVQIMPLPSPDHLVRITAPAVGAAWYMYLPERVFADPERILVDHRDTPVQWTVASGGKYTLDGSRGSIEFHGEMKPAPNGVALVFTIHNRDSEALSNVVNHVCLSHDHMQSPGGETFADPQHNRTYIVTAQGLADLDSIDRGGPPDGIRSHYLLMNARPISFFLTVPFWGKLSAAQATEPWIAGTSNSGEYTVATWWEKAVELFQNSDKDNRCIHSDPAYGDLAPGQSVTVRGRLDIVHGTAADALLVYRRERAAMNPGIR